MNKNPFVTESFIKTWGKYFNNSLPLFTFSFIKEIAFIKHNFLPYYINVGNSLTNGITYALEDQKYDDYKGKIFLIKDLPSYHKIDNPKGEKLKLKKVFQYEGYKTNISDYDSLDTYLKTIYKSNSRSKLRRNINRLEACFTVNYKMYFGSISQTEFDVAFKSFYKLLEKRYNEKGKPCGELQPEIWRYYTELAYKMVNDKTASLFVIYANNKPIGVTFSYHFDNVLIEALTVFDIDFYRFNIGHTTILKMLEWSFNNNIRIFDYTQGDFEYKRRWSDRIYDTSFHILYDSKSIKSVLTARFLDSYFILKRIFREKKYNEKYHYYKHKFLPNYKSEKLNLQAFKVVVFNENDTVCKGLQQIDLQLDTMISQRKALYDYLYMNPEEVTNLKVFKDHDKLFYVQTKGEILKIFIDG